MRWRTIYSGSLRCLIHYVAKLGDRWQFAHSAERGFNLEAVTHAVNNLSSAKRMPANLKEVLLNSHPVPLQDLLPQATKNFFGWIAGPHIFLLRCIQIGLWQTLAIDLPIVV